MYVYRSNVLTALTEARIERASVSTVSRVSPTRV